MFYADCHIHSKYSRATSKSLCLKELAYWASKKGLSIIATGDFTHPAWFEEIKENLIYLGDGTFKLKDEIEKELYKKYVHYKPVKFILSVEISTIYKQDDKTRKVHHVCFCPDIETAARFRNKLEAIGNIKSDGRPILGLNSRNLFEILLESGKDTNLIPAHIWTPWFSVLGSKSGFDSIEECYGDLTNYIYALETGLSSDPYMNWRVSKLDKFRLVSNSDAHSANKLAREATIFDCDENYYSIFNALKNGAGYVGTVEFYPEEGKYHIDGHRKCNVMLNPKETNKLHGICPVCSKPLTIGVLNRVEELADRDEENLIPPKTAGKVISLVPLNEIIAEIFNVSSASKKVEAEYERLLNIYGNELFILNELDTSEIKDFPKLKEALNRLRQGKVIKNAGYDGVYGTIKLFSDEENSGNLLGLKIEKNIKPKQKFVIKAFEADNEAKEDIKQEFLEDIYQKEAIEDTSKKLLIKAGPGSGKTTVLTKKIAKIIKNGVNPNDILAITFTKKAANELTQRLTNILNLDGLNIHTFHSFCYEILKKEAQNVGLSPDFQVISEKENEFLEKNDCLTFDELISNTLNLPLSILEKYKKKYIFIDEYQDIDINQYNLIKLLFKENIFAIGDVNQAIYAFRGGSSKYFENFKQDFKDAKIITLKNNYRSNSVIVNATNQMIDCYDIIAKYDKPCENIIFHSAQTPKAQAQYVISTIEKMLGGLGFFSMDLNRANGFEDKYNFSDFAILYRSKSQAKEIIEALNASSMPYANYSDDLIIENKHLKKFLKQEEFTIECFEKLKDKIEEFIFEYLKETFLNSKDKQDFINKIVFLKVCDIYNKKADRISLMTMHSSKGLEFNCVFIIGLEEGIIPSKFALTYEQLQEEKRLLYVAMTRAKNRLILCNSQKRLDYKEGIFKPTVKSRFLDNIEKTLFEITKAETKPKEKALQLKLFS